MAQPTIQQTFDLALQRHQAGRLQEAEQLYRQVLVQQPGHFRAMHYLGVIANQAGRRDIAVDLIRRAIVLKPNYAEAYGNLGVVLKETGQLDDAIAAFRQAIALSPNNADAHYNLGNALRDKGQLDDAIAAFGKAIALKPNDADNHNNLGTVLQSKGQLDEALAAYRRAIGLSPNYADAHYNLGSALMKQKQLDGAIAAFRKAIALRPSYVEAYNNLGVALANKEEMDQAIAVYRQAIACNPNYAEAYSNLGNALKDKGQLDEAMAVYRQAIALKPDYGEARVNLGVTLLLRGEFERGWPEYEWRWKIHGFPSPNRGFSQPVWDGGDLGGRAIFLHSEQGFGDTIQFSRYVPLVAERGGRVLVGAPPELIRLLRQLRSAERWITTGEPLPAFDVQCSLLSLPRIFATNLQNIPPQRDLPVPDPQLAQSWRRRVEQQSVGLKVGLVWAGTPTHTNDRNRSMALSLLAPLATAPDICLYSLQKGEAAKQTAKPPSGMRIIDWTDELHDFADTAALIANLDLIISVDTSVAHLTAAMGKPVWLMLPLLPDWRWLQEREDSPWYPTMRLFRQPAAGDWPGVISRVVAALGAFRDDKFP